MLYDSNPMDRTSTVERLITSRDVAWLYSSSCPPAGHLHAQSTDLISPHLSFVTTCTSQCCLELNVNALQTAQTLMRMLDLENVAPNSCTLLITPPTLSGSYTHLG